MPSHLGNWGTCGPRSRRHCGGARGGGRDSRGPAIAWPRGMGEGNQSLRLASLGGGQAVVLGVDEAVGVFPDADLGVGGELGELRNVGRVDGELGDPVAAAVVELLTVAVMNGFPEVGSPVGLAFEGAGRGDDWGRGWVRREVDTVLGEGGGAGHVGVSVYGGIMTCGRRVVNGNICGWNGNGWGIRFPLLGNM